MDNSPQAGSEIKAIPSPDGLRLMTEATIILVFASNTEVLNVEDFLEEAELPFELVPVPKEVNPNCGLAISFQKADESLILAQLKKASYLAQAAYIRHGDDFALYEGFLAETICSEA